MSWGEFSALLNAAVAESPELALVGALCIFCAGAWAGFAARGGDLSSTEDAGDTHTGMGPLPPMRTANSSLIDLQARRIQQESGAHPHARAGKSHLKASYDSRKKADTGDSRA